MRFHGCADNSIIPGVEGVEYTIVPNDVGHHISVQVVPRSADGLFGKPVSFFDAQKSRRRVGEALSTGDR